jgi:hypothetical protein
MDDARRARSDEDEDEDENGNVVVVDDNVVHICLTRRRLTRDPFELSDNE